jgi:hypothetical protein
MADETSHSLTSKKTGKPTRKPRWYKAFLSALRDGGNVRQACDACDISRTAAYDAYKRDPEFASLWDEAMDDATDSLEREARRRAERGVDEPVFYQGETVGTVRKYSDTLLIFLLKAHKPERFRDTVQKVALTDPTGKKEYKGMSIDERAAAIAAVLAKAQARKESATDGDVEPDDTDVDEVTE